MIEAAIRLPNDLASELIEQKSHQTNLQLEADILKVYYE